MQLESAAQLRAAIIGPGRLGRALARTLRCSGSEVIVVGRGDDLSRIDAADVVFVCVPDDAVHEVARAVPGGRPVVTCSGSVELGEHLVRFHPLRAFTGSDDEHLSGATVAITARDPGDRRLLHELALQVGAAPFDLAPGHAATWHAAAVMASNHVVALIADACKLAERSGVPALLARHSMAELAAGAVERVGHLGPAAALTGPVSRGDLGTIRRHLDALDAADPELADSYRGMSRRTAHLAGMTSQMAPLLDAPMQLSAVATRKELDAVLGSHRAAGRRIGFVPTMGALHAGHAELVRRAQEECDVVVVSCYVNPTQFGAGEDLDRYPRTPERDARVAAAAGAHVLWRPSDADIYGDVAAPVATDGAGALGERLEGAHRPGHFDGVVTVVRRLLDATRPDVLYLGEKDFQQVAVIRSMLHRDARAVDLRVVATVRDEDGLALSSRNAYLEPAERNAARAIPDALRAAADAVARGVRNAAELRGVVEGVLASQPRVDVEYVEVAAAESLDEVTEVDGEIVVLVAVRIGATRLIDNIRLQPRAARTLELTS